MTNDRVCANGTDLPELLNYIGDMQVKAMRLQHVLTAAGTLEGCEQYHGQRSVLIELAEGLSRELNQGLDIVNLPEVEA